MPDRSGRLLAAAVVAGAVLTGGAPRALATELGVYLGASCGARDKLPNFERFVGRRVDSVQDAADQGSWAHLVSSARWTSRCWKGARTRFDLSLPMLAADSGTLAEGAAGKYDDAFRTVGRELVADGHADAIVRIGWEANAGWMPWAAAKNPDAYVAFWRRIASVLRAVPGQRFRLEWCTQIGRFDIDPSRIYPGDDVVDVIGADIYDEVWSPSQDSPERRFAYYRTEPYGLAWVRDFAAAHHKPAAYSEWAVTSRHDGHGGGDDPYFVEQMALWFRQTGAAYQVYFDLNLAGQYDDTIGEGSNPLASAAYRRAFAAP